MHIAHSFPSLSAQVATCFPRYRVFCCCCFFTCLCTVPFWFSRHTLVALSGGFCCCDFVVWTRRSPLGLFALVVSFSLVGVWLCRIHFGCGYLCVPPSSLWLFLLLAFCSLHSLLFLFLV